ncbi:hypothetical protein, partial [Actinomadura napierensis]|uniref:hypothetical protein n=1 Tax=Actinomadura napierensis TaxID=267854 RepID=UPI0031DC413C
LAASRVPGAAARRPARARTLLRHRGSFPGAAVPFARGAAAPVMLCTDLTPKGGPGRAVPMILISGY